ncbi:MAG: single-stranded DNA-binding protein, partial [Candidatus Promineifilaceae bacterium]
RKQAEICNEFLSVGSKVLIEGRIRADENGNPRLWTRKDGSVSSSFEITANNVTFLSSKVEDEALGGRENNTYPAGGGDPDIEIDDIPFVRPILSTLDCDPIGLSPEAAHILIDFPTN